MVQDLRFRGGGGRGLNTGTITRVRNWDIQSWTLNLDWFHARSLTCCSRLHLPNSRILTTPEYSLGESPVLG